MEVFLDARFQLAVFLLVLVHEAVCLVTLCQPEGLEDGDGELEGEVEGDDEGELTAVP
jgi:hypothetical protein